MKIISLLIITGLISCKKSETATDATKPSRNIKDNRASSINASSKIQFKETTINFNPSCKEEQCVAASVTYPKAQGNTSVDKNINVALESVLKKFIDGENNGLSLQAAGESFVKSAAVDLDENSEMPYSNSGCEVQYQSKTALSFSCGSESYGGGAHPNNESAFVIVDVKTGKRIENSELIKDRSKLSELLHTEMQKKYKDQFEQNVINHEEGTPFPISKNIGLTKSTFLFHYNTYEIAPYVSGELSVEIEKKSLKGIVTTLQ